MDIQRFFISLSRSFIREKKWLFCGFTLLELLIVIAILGILVGIATPYYLTYTERARITMAIIDIRSLEREITVYNIENYILPNTLNDIGCGNKKDPWGNLYKYLNYSTVKGKGKMRKDRFLVPINDDYDLYSVGKDGKSVTPLTAKASRDDIIRANNGEYIGIASRY